MFMTINEKLVLISNALDLNVEDIQPEKHLEELEEWDSLGTIAIITMLDKHFQVQLKAEDIESLVTVNDILRYM